MATQALKRPMGRPRRADTPRITMTIRLTDRQYRSLAVEAEASGLRPTTYLQDRVRQLLAG